MLRKPDVPPDYSPARPKLEALHARRDAKPRLSLHAQWLQGEGIGRAPDQRIGAEADADRGARIDTGVVAGQITSPS